MAIVLCESCARYFGSLFSESHEVRLEATSETTNYCLSVADMSRTSWSCLLVNGHGGSGKVRRVWIEFQEV